MRLGIRQKALIDAALLPALGAACASAPKRIEDVVWITRAEWSPVYLRDRDFIQHNCQLVRKEESPSEVRNVGELKAAAQSLAANAVVVESRPAEGDRTSFYSCDSLPSAVTDAQRAR